MESSYKDIIAESFKEVKLRKDTGQLATYIPELANVNETKFGVHVMNIDGSNFGFGDNQEKFSIQCVSRFCH